jgi:hypothetical protein
LNKRSLLLSTPMFFIFGFVIEGQAYGEERERGGEKGDTL